MDSVGSRSLPVCIDVALLLLLFLASVFDLPSLDMKPPPNAVGGGVLTFVDEPFCRRLGLGAADALVAPDERLTDCAMGLAKRRIGSRLTSAIE